MKTRIIRTEIYRDSNFRSLSDKDKFIVLFLLTNEYLEPLPVVKVDIDLLSFHCSTNAQYLIKLIEELSYFEVFYKDDYLIVGEKFTYANYKGGKTASRKQELYESLPDSIRELTDIDGRIAQPLLNRCSTLEHINHKPKIINHKPKIINSEIEKSFEEFWKAYPRKIEKQGAKEKYTLLIEQDNALADKILKGLNEQLPTMEKQEVKFIPHPTTWLNGKRWEDEVPKQKKQFEHQREATELF